MAEVELSNLTKRFPPTTAVNRVNLTIHDGEFFVLVGPSGCGKSTLLNLIVGLETATEGDIRVDGERINDVDPKDRNMAMVFQSYAIYPHMTVRQNIAFPLRMAGVPPGEIDRRVARATQVLELEDVCDRKPQALSGGQRQRVAMGRAIVREPKAFLLDEPLSNLDARLRVQMRTEIARLQHRLATTTIYVTHDQTEAMTLGDRIAVMRSGEVLQVGTPRELYESPRHLFVAGFVGSPPMNFLPARLDGPDLELPAGRVALAEETRKSAEKVRGPLIAGFRPEDLHAIPMRASEGRALPIQVRVDILEWLGSDLFVYFDVDSAGFPPLALPQDLDIAGSDSRPALVARIDPATRVSEGDTLGLRLDTSRLHLFDAASGTALGS